MAGHAHIERWSLLMHRHIADRIEGGDLAPLRAARQNLANWRRRHGELTFAQSEWGVILAGPLPQLLAILRDSGDQEAIRLRGNSPFAGALDDRLRVELLHEARAA